MVGPCVLHLSREHTPETHGLASETADHAHLEPIRETARSQTPHTGTACKVMQGQARLDSRIDQNLRRVSNAVITELSGPYVWLRHKRLDQQGQPIGQTRRVAGTGGFHQFLRAL
jgi:hypothetical protein